MSGATGDVFRAPKRNRHGDAVDDDGNPVGITDKEGLAFVGTIENIVMGSMSAVRTADRQETSDGDGQLGILKSSPVQVRMGDRITIDGSKYEIRSRPQWTHAHSMTGTVFQRVWVDVSVRNG